MTYQRVGNRVFVYCISVIINEAGDADLADGERMTLSTKEIGNCEIYPQSMEHSPNGRLLVCFTMIYYIY